MNVSQKCQNYIDTALFSIPDDIDQDCRHMFSMIFIQYPSKRPSAYDCLRFAYIAADCALQDPDSDNFQATTNQAVNLFDSNNLTRKY